MTKPLTRQQTKGNDSDVALADWFETLAKNADGRRIGGLEQCASHESCGADNTDSVPESPVVADPSAPRQRPLAH